MIFCSDYLLAQFSLLYFFSLNYSNFVSLIFIYNFLFHAIIRFSILYSKDRLRIFLLFFITFSSSPLLIFYFLLPFQYLSHLSPLQSNVQNPCGSLYTLKVFQTLRSSLTRRFSHIVCSSPAEFHGEGFWKRQYPYIHEYLFEEAIRVESSFPMQGLSTVIDRELLVVIPATFIS